MQMVPTLVDRARRGKLAFVVGDGHNVVDFTYVGNVVHSHLQAVEAAHKWLAGKGAGAAAAKSGGRRKSVSSSSSSSSSSSGAAAAKGASAFPANGKTYFITNGEPLPFWDFMNFMWLGLGYRSASYRIPYKLVLGIAHVAQFFASIVGKVRGKDVELQLSPSRIQIVGTVHYYSIANANRDLGYRPLWTLQQGVYLTLKSFAALQNDKPLAPATVKNARDGNLFTIGLLKDPSA
jgi:sterol-4alpha-carboxylate 3-dehydrogenase (decarboxylating)